MAHRIKYLVMERNVNPNSICILMFNRLARQHYEIQLEPTVKVMSAVQRLASGVHRAEGELIASVTHFGGFRRIMENLITRYLPDIGDRSLIGKVTEVVATSPAFPFAYRFAYPPPKVVERKKPPRPEPLHPAWDSVRF